MQMFQPVPIRLLAPNAVTAAGMALGFLSLAYSAAGEFVTAAWLIALAALVDKLDGSVARALRASSEFGVQFDSFSDFCTFGLSPAALCWYAMQQRGGPIWQRASDGSLTPALWALAALCILYAVMAATRLARFNVTTAEHPTLFLGLPTTLSGGMAALSLLTTVELGVDHASMWQWFPLMLAANALLMVSNLPLPKLQLPAPAAPRAFFVLNGAAVYLLVTFRLNYWYPLVVLVAYVIVGFTRGVRAERLAVRAP